MSHSYKTIYRKKLNTKNHLNINQQEVKTTVKIQFYMDLKRTFDLKCMKLNTHK